MRLSLALIGCGKMGGALLSGWVSSNIDYDITIIQPDPLSAEIDHNRLRYLSTPPHHETFDIILFAVKPQILDQVIGEYKGVVHDTTLILSIAAGKSIKTFENVFGTKQAIIRTMPNTPAAIGQGITAMTCNIATSNNHKALAEALFATCGSFIWLEDETQMDAVTAISGSGPAYLFYFIECLRNAAQDIGLSAEISNKIARQTVIGAAALAAAAANQDISTLRKNVTSPGGTTAAALNILMNGELESIMKAATKAAAQRSKELSS